MGACESTDTCNTVGGTSSTSNTDPKMTFVPNKKWRELDLLEKQEGEIVLLCPSYCSSGHPPPTGLVAFCGGVGTRWIQVGRTSM